MTQENESRPIEPGDSSPPPLSAWSRQWPWILIALVVLLSLGTHFLNQKQGGESSGPGAMQMIRMQSHLLIGLKSMVDRRKADVAAKSQKEITTPKAAPEDPKQPEAPENGAEPSESDEAGGAAEAEESEEASEEGFFAIPHKLLEDQLVIGVNDLEEKATGPRSARAVATVMMFIGEANTAMEVLAANPSTSSVHAATHRLLTGTGPSADGGGEEAFASDLAELEADLGWFAQMAKLKDLPADNPERMAFMRATESSMGRFQAFQLGMVAAFAGGLVLLIMAMIRAGRGELQFRFQPLSPQGGIRALQGFSVYLAAFTFIPLGILGLISVGLFPRDWFLGIWPSVFFGLLAVVLGLAWARRGSADGAMFRREWGLYRGEGVLQEVRCGLIGYFACLPIFLVGVLLTAALEQWIVSRGGAPGSHPVALELQANGQFGLLLLLATVSAPITEEIMFRGGFYGSMRRHHRVLASGFFVGFIFAAVHPQGIGHIPALMAMAIGFALLREWRGSLIAPISAHALHNGLAILSAGLLPG